ncbi:MAG: DUF456 family protein [Acidobacteriota bacterium]
MLAVFWIVGLALVIAGVVGCVVPPLPGPPLLFLGLLSVAAAERFTKVGWPTLVVLGFLTLAAVGIDLFAGILGARHFRASKLALLGATLGGLAGIFLGLPGIILGPFVGAVAGEWISRRDLRQAGKVGIGTWLGLVAGAAAKLALAVAMLGLFAFAYAL